ncbi:MAG: GH92 family glycosyl hydrolase [Methylacidiphilales bacterium]|nr:GH92 family glycosyl hydrolase [Candidatus Methylacidiphilales bacterium]
MDYVNTNIGGVARLLQAIGPDVQMPHGMMSIVPRTRPKVVDRYLSDKIFGFPAGAAVFMPTTGAVDTVLENIASDFDHDLETATPYFYSVLLEKYDIQVEYTVSDHAVFYRFHFPEKQPAHLLWWEGKGSKGFNRTGPASLQGEGPNHLYWVAECSAPIAAMDSSIVISGKTAAAMTLTTSGGEWAGVRIGISRLSAEQARINLKSEMPDWDFATARNRARDVWNKALTQIVIKGGTERERTIFYTALYHSKLCMVNFTENGQYVGFDEKVHEAGNHPYYTIDSLWDTYRTAHPLQLLLEPHRQEDMVQSYVRMYEQSGWMPSVPDITSEHRAMIGYHADALIADTFFKGYRNFDVEKAYEGMRKNAMEATLLPYRNGPATKLDSIYREKGFFPALGKPKRETNEFILDPSGPKMQTVWMRGERETEKSVHPFESRQAVSVTLEAAYDDWCCAQMARALNKQDDYEYFMKRAYNYKNVFDSRIGFMAPKTADGNWAPDFDPLWSSGPGGRDYFTESNSWTYTFHVQHDFAGLINLMGGRDKFIARLDALYVEQYGNNMAKHHFLYNFPDMTGLIGQYAQGNEPAFHIPYLYCYAGQPWKTQRRIRETLRLWFNDGPEGIPGDEDYGAMSSYYVLSAMGFYPVCPGSPTYVIGSPSFEEVKITRDDGAVFTITARNVSPVNKYIQSAKLNKAPLDKPWFNHSDLIPGGSLVFEMGPRPNKSWGSAPDAVPPSMSH